MVLLQIKKEAKHTTGVGVTSLDIFFKDIWKHFQPKPAVFHMKSDRLLALVCWWFSSVMSAAKRIFLTTSASSLRGGQERRGDGEVTNLRGYMHETV